MLGLGSDFGPLGLGRLGLELDVNDAFLQREADRLRLCRAHRILRRRRFEDLRRCEGESVRLLGLLLALRLRLSFGRLRRRIGALQGLLRESLLSRRSGPWPWPGPQLSFPRPLPLGASIKNGRWIRLPLAQTLGVQRCRSSLPHTAGQSLSKSRAKPSVSDTLLCSIRSQSGRFTSFGRPLSAANTRISTPLRVKSLWLRCISSMDAQCWKISPSSSAPSSPNRLLKSFKIFSCWDFLQMSTMSGTDFDVKSLREKSISSYPLPFSRAMRTRSLSRSRRPDCRKTCGPLLGPGSGSHWAIGLALLLRLRALGGASAATLDLPAGRSPMSGLDLNALVIVPDISVALSKPSAPSSLDPSASGSFLSSTWPGSCFGELTDFASFSPWTAMPSFPGRPQVMAECTCHGHSLTKPLISNCAGSPSTSRSLGGPASTGSPRSSCATRLVKFMPGRVHRVPSLFSTCLKLAPCS